jgi:putative oxygen-independent coproporphyrinogen III oxidase
MSEFGVYVHIPFCRHRCDYCAFATWTDKDDLIADYVEAVCEDIARTRSDGLAVVDTVFFGGGTPTRIAPHFIADIVSALPLSNNPEVTVECNPDDVTFEMMEIFAAAGVNRVSFGVQSMVPRVLEILGRTHNPDNVRTSVDAARRAGISSINLDVMYGAATETVDEWRTTVEQVIALDVTHVSAYGLTVEAGTPLALDPTRYPDDDDQADKYMITDQMLMSAGFENYEISNWSLPGHQCRHNKVYWSQGNYQGFGCAAHSHADGRRWWNVRTPERYITCVRNGESVEAADEVLDDETRAREALELSLRTTEGVPVGVLDEEELAGLIERRGNQLVLTPQGRLLANEVILRLRPR